MFIYDMTNLLILVIVVNYFENDPKHRPDSNVGMELTSFAGNCLKIDLFAGIPPNFCRNSCKSRKILMPASDLKP